MKNLMLLRLIGMHVKDVSGLRELKNLKIERQVQTPPSAVASRAGSKASNNPASRPVNCGRQVGQVLGASPIIPT